MEFLWVLDYRVAAEFGRSIFDFFHVKFFVFFDLVEVNFESIWNGIRRLFRLLLDS